MQRYLATAAVFPGLFFAQNLNSQQNSVYAKSSKSSSRSSSKSSSSSSKSSSSSQSSSAHSSSKSLTNKSSFRNSSIAQKPYVRQSGNKRFINKRRFIKDKQQEKSLSIVGMFSLLGLVTRYFYRYERLRYSLRYVKSALNSAQNINLSSLSKQFDGKLVYGNAPLITHTWQNRALTDYMFGISASSPDSLRLFRKVEVYKEEEEEDKSKWHPAQYIQSFHPEIFHPCMKERVILPERVEIGEYELSTSQLMNIGLEDQKQMSFDTDAVDDRYQDIKDSLPSSATTITQTRSSRIASFFRKSKVEDNQVDNKQEELTIESTEKGKEKDAMKIMEEYRIIERIMNDPSNQDFQNMLSTHPFSYANRQGKDIIFQDDAIHIVKNIDKPAEGDMRISFHELRPILHATIIAQQSGQSFTEYQIEELSKLKLNLRLFVGGKQQEARFDIIDIIKEGKIDKEDLIKDFIKQKKSQSRTVSLALASIIYLIYAAIFDSIGEMMNPFNWFGKKAEQRKIQNKKSVIQKKGNSYSLSKKNTGIISGILAVPFAGAHAGSVSLFALARSFAGVLCGGAVGAFLIYSIYKDYHDDKELINNIGEDEEEEIEDIDEGEHQILSMLQNSEIEDK